MKRTQISDLAAVTEAIFQKEFQILQPVLQAEARIKKQLANLDTQVRRVRQDSEAAEGYKVTGTDVLWNGWESATRRQLNMELARLRSQKLTAMNSLRKAFGRKQAVGNLANRIKEERRRALSTTQ